MSKFFSFTAGLFSGSVVGAVAALLLAPAAGEETVEDAKKRWEMVLDSARSAMEAKEAEMWSEFEQMKQAGKPK